MSSDVELAGARELLELKIGEVSLVDKAANKKQFLVVKRLQPLQEDNVSKSTENITIVKALEMLKALANERLQAISEAVTKLQGSIGEMEKKDVVKAFDNIFSLTHGAERELISVSKQLNIDPSTLESVIAKAKAEEEADKAEDPKGKGKKKFPFMKANAEQVAAVSKVQAFLAANAEKSKIAGDIALVNEMMEAMTKTAGVEGDADVNTADGIADAVGVEALVTKAKRLTKGRLAVIRDALQKLDTLLKEVEGDGHSSAETDNDDVSKMVDGITAETIAKAVAKALAPLAEELKALKKGNSDTDTDDSADDTEIKKELKALKKQLDVLSGTSNIGGDDTIKTEVEKGDESVFKGMI